MAVLEARVFTAQHMYGNYFEFDFEQEARDFKALFPSREFGLLDLFRDPQTGKWIVTQWFRAISLEVNRG